MTRNLLAAMALAGILGLAVSASPLRADDWSKSYTVNGRADLSVATGDGDVTVTGTDQTRIDAHVTTCLLYTSRCV